MCTSLCGPTVSLIGPLGFFKEKPKSLIPLQYTVTVSKLRPYLAYNYMRGFGKSQEKLQENFQVSLQESTKAPRKTPGSIYPETPDLSLAMQGEMSF